jgi:hypothetical protein
MVRYKGRKTSSPITGKKSKGAPVARSRQVCINWVVEALLIALSWLGVASDLNTQRLSRQQQADNTLEIGNHVLTEITVGTSRPQQAPAGLSGQPKRGLFATAPTNNISDASIFSGGFCSGVPKQPSLCGPGFSSTMLPF